MTWLSSDELIWDKVHLWSHLIMLKWTKIHFRTGRPWYRFMFFVCSQKKKKNISSSDPSGLKTLYSRYCAVIAVWFFCSHERKKQSRAQLMHWPLHFRKKTSNQACKSWTILKLKLTHKALIQLDLISFVKGLRTSFCLDILVSLHTPFIFHILSHKLNS